ncbi:MAG TPA: integrase core domain-containing protein [Burkholderiaceae bacterium]|jgi:putative transposase|nr:integrase core domain-containing protein [Burkholderiaceae bacterium]
MIFNLSLLFCFLVCILAGIFLLHVPKRCPPTGAAAPDAPVRFFRPARHRRSGGRPKPPWVVEAVLALYVQFGTYRKAQEAFDRLHAHTGMTVSVDTVYRWVQKHLSDMEVVRRETRNRFPVHTPANLRWCLDGTGKVDAQGINHVILGILDHGTRRILTLVRPTQANAENILAEVANAVSLFGKPSLIRTDNASIFHSAVFLAGMTAMGIRHEFIAPGKPWQNRIERFFWTLKQKLNLVVPNDGAALDRLLAEFSCWYNVVRSHQHLHGLTPMEAWRGINPYATPPKSVHPCSAWDGLLRGLYIRR